MNALIIIPSRLGSTRLPNKPLADINGLPMIAWVLKQAQKTGVQHIYVAAAEAQIVDAVVKNGGKAVLTNPAHPSGTDRIYEALQKIEAEQGTKFDYIINVQGDLPTIEPELILSALEALKNSGADISTLAVKITNEAEKNNPNVVKAVVAWNGENTQKTGKALYFTRATAPTGVADLYHHIGLYVYTRAALEKFVSLKPSPLELSEKLEQLRALENNMSIIVAEAKTIPLGVDTPEDLEKAKKMLQG
jgi:3-deoxy-manno-octulosonate cytidylyltransferase (CMP-KDO synthetase)